jgi:two-component system, NtrC family, response regulator PilR
MGENAQDRDLDEFGNKLPVPESLVFFWDTCATRLALICRVIDRAGARGVKLDGALARTRSPFCGIAVIGMADETDGEGLRRIRDLKISGFGIIACGEGVDLWSVKLRCLPLLAGAGHLLDSAAPDFDDRLRRAIEDMLALEAKNQEEAAELKSTMRALGMVGESAAMMRVFRNVVWYSALSDLPVLITGETGTGKEGLARALHRLDHKRCHGPFLPVNCGAIAPSLAESEFFGHRRGAFTGAERDRKGLIRSAETGVLFLDEIGELDGALQAKLLRVLEENRVLGVGEDREVAVSVRVVAATNRKLEEMERRDRFRMDLLHRLNVLSIEVPALRDRPDDLAPLIAHFLEKYRSLCAGAPPAVGAEYLEALRQLHLPGNVRQLENLVRQALVRRKPETPFGLQDLPPKLLQELIVPDPASPLTEPVGPAGFEPAEMANFVVRLLEMNEWNLSRSLNACERDAMEAVMRRVSGNQSRAAELLGITPRSVYNKMRKHRLGSRKISSRKAKG